jgi:hypothetical protein
VLRAFARGGAPGQVGGLLVGGGQLLAQQLGQVLGTLHGGGLRGALGTQRLGFAPCGFGLCQLGAQRRPRRGLALDLVLFAQRAQLVDLVAVVARGGGQ